MAELQPDSHAGMDIPGFEHEPAPPPERRIVPPMAMTMRGVGLGGLATGFGFTAILLARKAGWLAAPVVALAGAGAFLSLWASLIHLTGGEKFDDHRWV